MIRPITAADGVQAVIQQFARIASTAQATPACSVLQKRLTHLFPLRIGQAGPFDAAVRRLRCRFLLVGVSFDVFVEIG